MIAGPALILGSAAAAHVAGAYLFNKPEQNSLNYIIARSAQSLFLLGGSYLLMRFALKFNAAASMMAATYFAAGMLLDDVATEAFVRLTNTLMPGAPAATATR